MKNLLLLSTLIINISLSHGQQRFVVDFEHPDYFNNTVQIDYQTNPNNIWQIGSPQKQSFDSAYSGMNVIITDTLNSYPTNDTSSFIIEVITTEIYEAPFLEAKFKIDCDSLKDFGLIEFSNDSGVTWINILTDSIAQRGWTFGGNQKPTLTGNSNGWRSIRYDADVVIGYPDTFLYKFTFISDSIDTGQEGWMLDDIRTLYWTEGIEENNYQLVISNAFPNPASNKIIIEFENPEYAPYDLAIHNNSGKLVHYEFELSRARIEINTKDFASGIYYYKLVNVRDERRSWGKFLIEK